MARPTGGTYHPIYQQPYIDAAQGETIGELIASYSQRLIAFINAIPEAKANYSYAESKWTVKQVLQHIIDTERIFTYRALCISRGETTNLPGFDENSYAANAPAQHRTLASLKEEFALVRKSTDMLFASFTEKQLQRVGTTNNYMVSVNALCFIVFGHNLHHEKVLRERYL
ncbi:DinB family protein [Parasediminibacterium sp. JCM 36343]|uniref:DinB family protein n=1 Tax=Parasediminibacterium sp. JCM 36343 TaxID=3374279 RepID=UPI0039788E2C